MATLTSATSHLEWLDEFDASDLLIEQAASLVRLIAIFLEHLDDLRRAHENVVAQRQREREVSAHTAVERLKTVRRDSLRPDQGARRTEVAEARKRLREMLREGAMGRWRQYSLDEVAGIAALAVDPEHPELAGAVSSVHSMLGSLNKLIELAAGPFRERAADWIGRAHERLRSYAYFTQQVNRNYLKSGKAAAWSRTCNVTSLAMVLRSLGITPHDFALERRDPLTRVYCVVQGRANCDANYWKDEISALLMPDFLQLVAIDWFWEQVANDPATRDRAEPQQIGLALKRASNAITGDATIFASLAARFGLRQYPVFPRSAIDSLPSVGRAVRIHFNRQEPKLRSFLAPVLSQLWPQRNASAAVSKLLWHIGFRPGRQQQKLGPTLTIDYGPVTVQQEQMIARLYDSAEGPPAGYDETRALATAMIRYVVAMRSRRERSAVSAEDRDRILHELEIDQVLALAQRHGMMRVARDVEQLWYEVASLFHCHAEGEDLYSELKHDLDHADLSAPIRPAINGILREWRETEELLSKYRRSSGRDLRTGAMAVVKPLLDDGASLVVLRKGHYVFLVDMDDDGILLNDPASLRSDGSLGRSTRYSWAQASRLAFFRAFHVFFHPDNPKGQPPNAVGE